ncbi:MAG: TatD family hydrolase [Bacilli bacterium]|nr:TatD family hydrolase [Bacilli bacterium]
MLVDTHAHLFNEYYDDIQGILDKAKSKGIDKVIVAADNIKTCYEVIEHAKDYDNYYFCLGIHPENVDDSIDELKQIIEDNKDNPKFVGIGEIGLDYYWTKDNKEKQKELFEEQLKIAEQYNKPVVVHSREATKDTIDILDKYKLTVDIHCFSGSKETAEIYTKKGYYLGIGGVITFKNANLKDVIKDVPLENLLLETDSPFLTPEPYRGESNDSSHVYEVAKFLANLKGVSIEEVEQKTSQNATKIFSI